MIGRRKLLAGLLAAPLVVRDYSVLMPVRALILPPEPQILRWQVTMGADYTRITRLDGTLVYLGPRPHLPGRLATRVSEGKLIELAA